MAERKTLTITQVEEVKKVGDKQIPKLSFKAKDGDKELSYFTFKSSLFELIKVGQTINAEVETSTREWEGNEYTDRRVVQVYVDGQPVNVKGGYRGKSPEELEQTARLMILAYAKDLAVAQLIPVENITKQADIFYEWLKGDKPASPAKQSGIEGLKKGSGAQAQKEDEDLFEDKSPTGKKVQNITELKGLLGKHKIATHEAYVILSIKSFMELVDLDKAWADIKEAKGIKNDY